MIEYDEHKAIAAMAAVLPEDCREEDSVFEVLDLLFDYFEESGQLDVGGDDDGDADVVEATAFIMKYLKRSAGGVRFTAGQIADMVRAELAYEESLL